jgi:predicted ATPase
MKSTPSTSTPPIKVHFALQAEKIIDEAIADIYIIPQKSNRKNHGFEYNCLIAFKVGHDEYDMLDGQCAIQGTTDLKEFLGHTLNSDSTISSHSVRQPFRTLLTDSKSYNILYKQFGSKRAIELLTAVQDIAVATQFSSPWRSFTSSREFSLAFIRSSEALFAYRRAKRIVQGLSIRAADARQNFSAKLIGRGPNVTFNFLYDKDNFFRGRISVIIGQNGSGKTASLSKLARGLADIKSKDVIINDRPDINQVLAFIHTSSRREFTPTSQSGIGRARVFTFNPATPKKYDSIPMTQLLVNIARSLGPLSKSLDILRDVIIQEFPHLKVCIPIKISSTSSQNQNNMEGHVNINDWMKGGELQQLEQIGEIDHSRPIRFVDEDNNVRKLSLGQQSFINFCLVALSNAGPSSAFIIDEPENFLHPNLISRFMRTLNKILDTTKSIAIIATHSPFVVREVQSAQVHVMWERDGVINVSHPRLQTLGANVASISDEVFGDDLPSHLYEELIAHAKKHSSTFAEALKKYSSELSTEALMLLRKKMESEDA